MNINEITMGDWLRVQLRSSQMIGKVTALGKNRRTWMDTEDKPTVIIKSAQGGAEVFEEEIIEKIDPVEEWNKLRPGEPVPEWLRLNLNQ